MKEIGEYLKETRIKNGVSLDEAAEDINMTANQLENIEEGNIRAFKDVYVLKDFVKIYSKYLGLEPEKVLDEFNDFLFEHTSKISLEDIKEARSKMKDNVPETKKVISPYTKEVKKKIKVLPILVVLLMLTLVTLISYIIIICVNDKEKVNTELSGNIKTMEEYYELTN